MAYKRLIVRWDKRQNDHVISYPRKCDGHLIHGAIFNPRMYRDFSKGGTAEFGAIAFEKSIADELKERGYDLTTLRFEISPKKLPRPAAGTEKEGR